VQYLPPGGYGYYDYGIAGYPWYDWSGPGFFGGGVFVFDRGHEFHRGFHDGFHRGSHGAFHEEFHGHGGFHGAPMAEGEYSAQPPPLQGCAGRAGAATKTARRLVCIRSHSSARCGLSYF
jgi:hypothetical protein